MNRVGDAGQGRKRVAGLLPVPRADATSRDLARLRGDPALRRSACEREARATRAAIEDTPGTANGIGAPISTTARRSARRTTPNAASTRSRRPGPCSPARAIPTRARAGDGRARRAPGQPRRRTDPAARRRRSTNRRHDPGYIKGYVPGVRENGGQYTHAAVWAAMAFARAGRRRARVGAVRADQPDAPADRGGRARPTKSSPTSSPPTSMRSAARRPRRLDLVHRLGGLDYRCGWSRCSGWASTAPPDRPPLRPGRLGGVRRRLPARRHALRIGVARVGADGATEGVALDGVPVQDGRIALVDDGGTHRVEVRIAAAPASPAP